MIVSHDSLFNIYANYANDGFTYNILISSKLILVEEE